MKISALPDASAFSDSDSLLMVQSATTKKALLSDLADYMRSAHRWELVDPLTYTADPASVSRITCSDTSPFVAGLPLKYVYSATTFYGIVLAVSEDAYIDIGGATLNVAAEITALYVGLPELVVFLPGYAIGSFGGSTSTNELEYLLRWTRGPARLVAFGAAQQTASDGAEAKINVSIDGHNVLTGDGGNGIQLSASANTWVANSAVEIDLDYYAIDYGDEIKVPCTVANTGTEGTYLGVGCTFVLE